jgi:hypothetical protein
VQYELTLDALVIASEKLGKLQKKAQKLGTTPITFDVVDEVFDTHTNELTGEKTTTKRYIVNVEGTEPIINGWTFIGTVEHEAAGNIIRLSPTAQSLSLDLTKYREGAQLCQHCGTIRNRKDTYIVAQLTDLEVPALRKHLQETLNLYFEPTIMQVGSSCLRDFLGYGDPEALVAYLESIQAFLAELQAAGDEESTGGGDGGGERYESIRYYLANTAAMIATHGWVSKAKALETDSIATVERVSNNMFLLEHLDKHSPSGDFRREVPVSPTPEHIKLADDALEWIRTEQAAIPVADRSDYIHNLIVATADDMFPLRAAGIVCSLIAAYQRTLADKAERAAAKATSRHIGNVGDKLTIPHVTVVRVFANDNAYGVSYKHIMRDRFGNTYTWSTGTELEVGSVYTIIGTVKAHTEYRDLKQTALTRCKYRPENPVEQVM